VIVFCGELTEERSAWTTARPLRVGAGVGVGVTETDAPGMSRKLRTVEDRGVGEPVLVPALPPPQAATPKAHAARANAIRRLLIWR
jgi:hypothetical protein